MIVSVVIPVYNAASWIGETLESVARQTYPLDKIELIVVDDASRDDSARIARSFIDRHSLNGEVVRCKKNAGVSSARNIGWRRATGEWIQFLDADDLLAPQKIELQATCASRLPNDVAVVYSSWQHLGLQNGVWRPAGPLIEPSVETDTLVSILQDTFFGYVGPTLVRRSFLHVVGGFDKHLKLGEDIDLMLRVAMAGGRFCEARFTEATFFYRKTPGSLWHQSAEDAEAMTNLARAFRRVEAFLREQTPHGLSEGSRRALANRYGRSLDVLFEYDRVSFRETLDWIGALGLTCPPDVRPSMRLVSKLLGYEKTLRLRSLFRAWAMARLEIARRREKFSRDRPARPALIHPS